MVIMTVTETGLPFSGPFRRADLDKMPDDGHRYELIDGALIVTPSPLTRHQDVVSQLHLVLARQCPPELTVMLAPFDVVLADDTVVIPDLLVTRIGDLTERDLPAPPLLAVEVLSPSTRRLDLHTKLDRYAEAGVPAYWTIDPAQPELTAWHLVDGEYAEVARVSGDEPWRTELPFPLALVPAKLRKLRI